MTRQDKDKKRMEHGQESESCRKGEGKKKGSEGVVPDDKGDEAICTVLLKNHLLLLNRHPGLLVVGRIWAARTKLYTKASRAASNSY